MASVAGTAALGGVRALTQFVVLLFVTATSMSTANVFTQILNITIALLFTQADKTVVSASLITGISLVMIFSTVYAFMKANKNVLKTVDEVLPWCAKEKNDKASAI